MEGLGEKFIKAREARNLSLEEAARMTKIRPAKLAEIEAEDFSKFPSLAYAKGFILIYGKFLNVDVSPYMEAFETSEHVTVEGYSYLQDNPAPAPRRTEVVRKVPRGSKSSFMPLVIGIVVLVVGFGLLKLMMDLRRLKTSGARDAEALAQATSTPDNLVAPRALPADSTPAPTVAHSTPTMTIAAATPTIAPVAVPTPAPTIAIAETAAPIPEADQEVRRAEPVNPEDLKKAPGAVAGASPTSVSSPTAASSPSPTPSPTPKPSQTPKPSTTPKPSPSLNANLFEVRPVRRTYVRVVVDGRPTERWLRPGEGLQFKGRFISIKALDPRDVQVRKNGKPVGRGDVDVRLQ